MLSMPPLQIIPPLWHDASPLAYFSVPLFLRGQLVPLLAQIPVPTLHMRADAMLGSTLDEFLWKQARQCLPAQGKAISIKGANHSIHWSQFDAFMQHLSAFIEGPAE
jgi:hypothetical protein